MTVIDTATAHASRLVPAAEESLARVPQSRRIPGVSPAQEFGVGLPLTLMRWTLGPYGHELETETGILVKQYATFCVIDNQGKPVRRDADVWRTRLEIDRMPDRIAHFTSHIPRNGRSQTDLLYARALRLTVYRSCGYRVFETIREGDADGNTYTIIDRLKPDRPNAAAAES